MEDSETQMGGSVNTRSMKRERVEQESSRQNDKETKVKGEKRKTDDSDMSELLDDGLYQFLMEGAKRLEMQMNSLLICSELIQCLCRANVIPLRELRKKNNSPLPLNNYVNLAMKNL